MARSTTPAGIGYKDKNDRNDKVFTPADSEFVAVTVDSAVRGVHAELGRFGDLVEALLARDKLDPTSPVDAQTAALINQAETLTRKAVNAVVETAKVSAFGVRVDAYGVVGNGVKDDTAAFHAAASAAATAGVPLVIPAGVSIGISSHKQLPEGLTMHTNGSTFQQLVPMGRAPVISLGPRSTVVGGLRVQTLGGDECQGVRVADAPDCSIDVVDVRSDVPGAGSGNHRDAALMIARSPHARVGRVVVDGYDWPVVVEDSDDTRLGWMSIRTYCRAILVRDSARVYIGPGLVTGQSANSRYAPGYNGVLLEVVKPGTGDGLVVDRLVVEDSGEHGFRIGGKETVAHTTFLHCTARRAGGTGFKTLPGPGGVEGNSVRARGVVFDHCTVEDAGQINRNTCGFLIQRADDVRITAPIIRKKDRAYSCVEGLRMSGVRRARVTGASIRDTFHYGVHVDAEYGNVEDLHIDGEIKTDSGQGIHLWNSGVRYRNIALDMFVENSASGGSAFYAGPGSGAEDTGTWAGVNKLRLTISEATPSETAINPNSSDTALGAFFAEVTGRRGGDPAFRGGSTWMDTRLNTFQVRRANVWATV